MQLQFPAVELDRYKSPTQIARVVTEAWAAENLYCAGCSSDRLEPTRNNTRAVDLICPSCREGFQLKSGKAMPTTRIVDAGYAAMVASIRSDANPNLIYLHYGLTEGVLNLLLIPRFFFAESCIEQRKPLSQSARRAGWVGCNIRLDRIAPEGRIALVANRTILPYEQVRDRYAHLAPLSNVGAGMRGWTLNVLQLLSALGRREFTLADAYTLEAALSQRFPNNRHIRPKIRQQLQALRDLGLVTFLGGGRYRLVA